jgi:hypothetical protein
VSATLWLLCTQSSSLIRGRKSATFWHDASLSVIRAAVDLTQGHTFFAPTPMMQQSGLEAASSSNRNVRHISWSTAEI